MSEHVCDWRSDWERLSSAVGRLRRRCDRLEKQHERDERIIYRLTVELERLREQPKP